MPTAARWRFRFVVPTAAALERLREAAAGAGVRHTVWARPGGMLEDHELLVDGDSGVLKLLAGLLALPGRVVVPPWPVTGAGMLAALRRGRPGGPGGA